MTSIQAPARCAAGRRTSWLLALSAALLPGFACAGPLEVLYERTVMTAANERCGLFAPPVGAALDAGRAQARNAALRAGADPQKLAATEQRARAAAGRVACNSTDLVVAAARVRTAFESYAKLTRMAYPGDLSSWRADRGAGRAARWRLAQDVTFGWNRMTFGLAGREGEDALVAVAAFPDGATPYSARLVLRDVERSPMAYLDRRAADLNGRMPLDRRMPPASALKTYTAQARSPAGADLAGKDLKAGWAFRFPPEAAAKLAALDPREAVAVDFVFPGDTVRRAYVEVGDFAAGRAFLQLAQR